MNQNEGLVLGVVELGVKIQKLYPRSGTWAMCSSSPGRILLLTLILSSEFHFSIQSYTSDKEVLSEVQGSDILSK